MWNAGLDEAQAGIKIARRNINNLRYADDTILMAESEEELKSFLINVKEESEKAGLKLHIQKMKIMASFPITSWKIDGEKRELEEDERGEWKSWLKTPHSKTQDYGIQSHHFMANRWGNNWNSDILYILELQKSLWMVTTAMKLKDACSLEDKLWLN